MNPYLVKLKYAKSDLKDQPVRIRYYNSSTTLWENTGYFLTAGQNKDGFTRLSICFSEYLGDKRFKTIQFHLTQEAVDSIRRCRAKNSRFAFTCGYIFKAQDAARRTQ